MSSIQSIETPQDYVNYTFNLSARGITEVTSELTGMSSTVSNLMGLMAFKTSEYLSNTEAMIVSLGYAAAATFTTATQQAIRFEQALANVKAIGGETINEVAIGEAAMQFSNKFGMNVDAMTEGLEALSRAGLTTTSVMQGVLEEGVKLSKLEGMDLEDSINNLISTTNLLAESSYDVNSQEYAEAVKAMNQHIVSTSESAPINAQNIIQTLQHVGGYASANQIDQDDLFAVIAQLGSKGTKGEMAGTALRAFIAAGQKDQAQRALSRIGLDVTDLWSDSGEAMLPVSKMKEVLDEALEAKGYSKQEKLEFYADFAGYKQANQIMKINVEEVQNYKKSIAQAWDLGTKLETILGTVHNNIQIIAQTTKNFLTKVGQTTLPILNAILQPIKWAVQLLDALPFSENIVGIGLMFLTLKGVSIAISRVVPAIMSLYSTFSRNEEKAKGIAGHFRNLKRDVIEAKETIDNWNNQEWLANKRIANDKSGMGAVEYGYAIAETLYGAIGGEEITKKPFSDLSKYEQHSFVELTSSLGKDTKIYQQSKDIIDTNIVDLKNAILALEPKEAPFIYEKDKNERSNRTRNEQINTKRESSEPLKQKIDESNKTIKENQKISEQTKKTLDNTYTAIEALKTYILSHTDKNSQSQYDIGKGIMSIARPFADIIADSIFKRFNLKGFQTDIGEISFDKSIGKQATNELNQIIKDVRDNVSDLPDISFYYHDDINEMRDKATTLTKDIKDVAKIFSNIDFSSMNLYQGRRALKTVDVKAMGQIGLNYSEMMNEAYIREVLNQDNFDKNNKFIKKIYDEQIDLLAESLNVDISDVSDKVQKIEKIYNKFHSKGNKKSISDTVASSTQWYHDTLNKRVDPSKSAAKWLNNDVSRFIMDKLNIQYDASNSNMNQQLIDNIKNADLETKWVAQQLIFAFQKSQASGIYSGPEADELKYMVTHLEALNKSITRLVNEQGKPLGYITGEERFINWEQPIGLSHFNQSNVPTVNTMGDVLQDFLDNGYTGINKTLPVPGVSAHGAIELNPEMIAGGQYEGKNFMEKAFITYIHEIAHTILQHELRGVIGSIPDTRNNKVEEIEARKVEVNIGKALGLNMAANQYRLQAFEQGAEKDNVSNYVRDDLVNAATVAIANKFPQVMQNFLKLMGTESVQNTSNLGQLQGRIFLQEPEIIDEKIEQWEQEITTIEDEIKTLKSIRGEDYPYVAVLEGQIADLNNKIANRKADNLDSHGLLDTSLTPIESAMSVIIKILNTINNNLNIIARIFTGDKQKIETKSLLNSLKTFKENELNFKKHKDIVAENIEESIIAQQGAPKVDVKEILGDIDIDAVLTSGVVSSELSKRMEEEQKKETQRQQEEAQRQQEEAQRQQEEAQRKRIESLKQHIEELKAIINQPILLPTDIAPNMAGAQVIQQLRDQAKAQKELEVSREKLDKALYPEKYTKEAIMKSTLDSISPSLNIIPSQFDFYPAEKRRIQAQQQQAISQIVSPFYLSRLQPTSSYHVLRKRKTAQQRAEEEAEEKDFQLNYSGGYNNYILSGAPRFQRKPIPFKSPEEAMELAENVLKAKQNMESIKNAYLDWNEEVRDINGVIKELYSSLIEIQNIDIKPTNKAIENVQDLATKTEALTENVKQSANKFYSVSAQFQDYFIAYQEYLIKEEEKLAEAVNEIASLSYAGDIEYSRKVSGLYRPEQIDLSGPVSREQGQKDIDAANAYINPPGPTQSEIAQQWLKSIEANTQAIEAQTELLNVAKNITEQTEEEADIKKAKEVLEEIIPIPPKTPPVITNYGISGYAQVNTEDIRLATIAEHNKKVQKNIEKMRPIFQEHKAPSVKETGEVDKRGRSKYVTNLVAEHNKEVQKSIEEMRPLFKQWREEANQAWEDSLEKINTFKELVNRIELSSLRKEVEAKLEELEKVAKYRQALEGKYDSGSSMIDEKAANAYIAQEELTQQLINTIPNAQATINQQQEQIKQKQNQEVIERFTTSDKTDMHPEDIEVTMLDAPSAAKQVQNDNRRNLNRLKESIHRAAAKVMLEEQKELIDWSIKQIDTIQYSIGATIADSEENYTYKQLKANKAAEQVRKNLDAQQKAEDALDEAKRIETEKNINNINRQNRQTFARMKRSEKRAKRLQDEAKQLEEDNQKALEAETERMKRIGEQQKQMLSDFTDALGFLLTVGEELNRKNIEDISSLPVTDEDWEQVDKITDEDYRASRRVANRMKQNAKNRKTPEELEQERIDKDWIENNGLNLTPEEFNRKLEEEENSFSKKELTDMKAQIRKNAEVSKEKREKREQEKEQERISTARQQLESNQEARVQEQKRINDAIDNGRILTPDIEEKYKDNPEELSKYITKDEFFAFIEEQNSWGEYYERMATAMQSVMGDLSALLEEQRRANEIAQEQKEKEEKRREKVEHANQAAEEVRTKNEKQQEMQQELLNVNVRTFNKTPQERLREMQEELLGIDIEHLIPNMPTSGERQAFWNEQDELEQEGIQEEKVKKRQRKVEHANQVAEEVRARHEEQREMQQELLNIDVKTFNKTPQERLREMQDELLGINIEHLIPNMPTSGERQAFWDEQDRLEQEAIKEKQERPLRQAQEAQAELLNVANNITEQEEEAKAKKAIEYLFADKKTLRKDRLDILENKDNLTKGEKAERLSLKARIGTENVADKIQKRLSVDPEQSDAVKSRLESAHDKLTNIIGPMEGFNASLQRAADIFPPLTGVAWGFSAALEFMYGIEAALNFMQFLLNNEKVAEFLVNTGLIPSEAAVTIAKGEETVTTWALTGAILGLEAVLSGPVLIVIGLIIAAIAAVYISEKMHAEALKESKKQLEESNKSIKLATARYKSMRNARMGEMDATRKHMAALKESIALKKLESERYKQDAIIRKKNRLETDPIWGENNSLRTQVQTKQGLGGLLAFLSPITMLAAGEYESIADKHAENTYQTRSIVDDANKNHPLTNLITGYDSQYARQVERFYSAHSLDFAYMDAYAPELENLYGLETKLQKVYGEEGARDSPEFLRAMQEVADSTGLSGEQLGQYLDYMQVEANVENARTVASAGFGDIFAETQREVNKILYPDQEGMGDLDNEENAMVWAAVEEEARKAKQEMFHQGVMEYLAAITALLDPRQWGDIDNHIKAGNKWLTDMTNIDQNKQRIAEDALEVAEADSRKDYGTEVYSYYGDTPFGGAVASAHAAGMSVPNSSSSSVSMQSSTVSSTTANVKNNQNKVKQLLSSSSQNTSDSMASTFSQDKDTGSLVFDIVDKALGFAKDYNPISMALDAIFSKDESSTTPETPQVNKYEIHVNTININTEDDPEKIKTAFMNLMIEMSEQVTPRQVSRTIGQQKTMENSNIVEGTDLNINANNNTNNNPM